MKRFVLAAAVASMAFTSLGATSTASTAAPHFDYAKEYCKYYKNKAAWTGSAYWWHRYYACLETYR